MKSGLFLLIWSSIFMASCQPKNALTDDELKQIISKKYETVRATLKSGNPTFVVNMHTKDAVQFLPNGTEVAGIEALKPFYEKVAASGVDINSKTTTIEKLTDDMAFEVGIYTATTKTGNQNTAKYIIIWKKMGDDWQILKAIDQAKL